MAISWPLSNRLGIYIASNLPPVVPKPTYMGRRTVAFDEHGASSCGVSSLVVILLVWFWSSPIKSKAKIQNQCEQTCMPNDHIRVRQGMGPLFQPHVTSFIACIPCELSHWNTAHQILFHIQWKKNPPSQRTPCPLACLARK